MNGKAESGNPGSAGFQPALLAAAQRWLKTPWCANSASCGERGGVSCQNLPRELYVESSLLPESFPRVAGDPRGVTANNEMELFLDSRPEFQRVARASVLQPGDLLGLCLPIDAVGRRVKERSVNHLGVLLAGNWFIHVLIYGATRRDLIHIPPWRQRVVAAWRLSTLNPQPSTPQ